MALQTTDGFTGASVRSRPSTFTSDISGNRGFRNSVLKRIMNNSHRQKWRGGGTSNISTSGHHWKRRTFTSEWCLQTAGILTLAPPKMAGMPI